MLYVFSTNLEIATPPQKEAAARSRLTMVTRVDRVWSTGSLGA